MKFATRPRQITSTWHAEFIIVSVKKCEHVRNDDDEQDKSIFRLMVDILLEDD